MQKQEQLMGVKFLFQVRNFIEFLRVAAKYYTNFSFCKEDLSLLTLYFAYSPFEISKDYLKKQRVSDIYAYGETPLTTMELIAKECQIQSSDTVFELGCGRGRTCFWLDAFIGCKVVGIEYIPEFVKRAQTIKERFHLDNIEFRQQDMLKTDLSGATVIYLYGTNFDELFIRQLIEKFRQLPSGTKIITISYALNEYAPQPIFEVMKRFSAPFPWGEADVYLQLIK